MNTAYILGAGASHDYADSYSGVRSPLASGFFSAYAQLPISEDFEVRVGNIVNYVHDHHGIPPERFSIFSMNAEAFMTEVDEKIRLLADEMKQRKLNDRELGNFFSWIKTYDQMIFLFAHVLNETQNGPMPKQYTKLVSMCDDSDTLITFNWDTLLDRALYESGTWVPDSGYGVKFRSILDTDWRKPSLQAPRFLLLKLHGSTNWLVNYVTRHLTTGERVMTTGQPTLGKIMIEVEMGFSIKNGMLRSNPEIRRRKWGCRPIPEAGELSATPCCFLRGPTPFRTYKNRYRSGYEDFCYFFPPNDPIDDIPLMPLIVPPTSFKLYDEFKHVLDPLWEEAGRRITNSHRIVIIGYSFPFTDRRVADLLRPLASLGTGAPTVQVVNPSPEAICRRITDEIGLESERVQVVAHSFDEYLRLGN